MHLDYRNYIIFKRTGKYGNDVKTPTVISIQVMLSASSEEKHKQAKHFFCWFTFGVKNYEYFLRSRVCRTVRSLSDDHATKVFLNLRGVILKYSRMKSALFSLPKVEVYLHLSRSKLFLLQPRRPLEIFHSYGLIFLHRA